MLQNASSAVKHREVMLCVKKKKAPIYFVVTSKKAHINTLDMSQLESFDEVL